MSTRTGAEIRPLIFLGAAFIFGLTVLICYLPITWAMWWAVYSVELVATAPTFWPALAVAFCLACLAWLFTGSSQ